MERGVAASYDRASQVNLGVRPLQATVCLLVGNECEVRDGGTGFSGQRDRRLGELLHPGFGAVAAGSLLHRDYPVRPGGTPVHRASGMGDPSLVGPGRRAVEAEASVGRAWRAVRGFALSGAA